MTYQYVANRNDAYFDADSFQTKKVKLESYQLVHANIRYKLIANKLSVFGAVSNIFNAAFEENIGFNTLGRNYKIGLNFKL